MLAWEKRQLRNCEVLIPLVLNSKESSNYILPAAWLILSLNRESLRPHVRVDSSCILRVPHVDEKGKLCLFTDEEELDFFSDVMKIRKTLERFFSVFVPALHAGDLDFHFYDEPINYWYINVTQKIRRGISKGGSNTVYLLSERSKQAKTYDSYIIKGLGYVSGEDNIYRKRFLQSRKSVREKIPSFEIAINFPYSPTTWPKTISEIRNVCQAMAGIKETQRFFEKNKSQISKLILLRAPNCDYAYVISGVSKTQCIFPKYCERADPRWLFGRYQDRKVKSYLSARIAVLGAGSLGSHVIQILSHSGVGEIHIVDPDNLSPANLGRHVLGMTSIGLPKCSELSDWLTSMLPSCKLKPINESAGQWLSRTDITQFNLILDLTGERRVREALETKRHQSDVSTLTGWMEPYVSAAHVVILRKNQKWIKDGVNIWDISHAFEDWPSDYILSEPGCSSRFSPYSASQLSYAAAMTAEACLVALNTPIINSGANLITIKSWVRGENYINALQHRGVRRNWATLPVGTDGILIERNL